MDIEAIVASYPHRHYLLLASGMAARLGNKVEGPGFSPAFFKADLEVSVRPPDPASEFPGGGTWRSGEEAATYAQESCKELLGSVSRVRERLEALATGSVDVAGLFDDCEQLRDSIAQNDPMDSSVVLEHASRMEELADCYAERREGIAKEQESLSKQRESSGLSEGQYREQQKEIRRRTGSMMAGFYAECGGVLTKAVHAGALFDNKKAVQCIGSTLWLDDAPTFEPCLIPASIWTAMVQRWLPSHYPEWGENYREYPGHLIDSALPQSKQTAKAEEAHIRAFAGVLRQEVGLSREQVEADLGASQSTSPSTENRNAQRDEWLAKAMILVRDHPEWSDAKIAREVKKNASTLSRSNEYQLAAGLARGGRDDRHRGHASFNASTGLRDIEAYAPDPAERDLDA